MRNARFGWVIVSCCLTACAPAMGDGDDEGSLETGVLSQGLSADSTWHVKNEKSHLCLGIDHGSRDNGAAVKQFPCQPGAPNQTWRVGTTVFVPDHRQFINQNSNRCLGVDHGSSDPDTALKQFTCGSGRNQQWEPEGQGGGTFRFRNALGLCMGVDHASTASGAQIKQFACSDATNQRWSVCQAGTTCPD